MTEFEDGCEHVLDPNLRRHGVSACSFLDGIYEQHEESDE